jgi:predicted glutamine amidotransferase
VVAHVREASVGTVRHENTHPFVHDRWLFAHNGTVARFRSAARVRRSLEAEIDPLLRTAIRGETDSERCFYLFLTRLSAKCSLANGTPLSQVRTALAETVSTVSSIADRAPRRSTLNFVVTDGRLLAACRHGKPLYAKWYEGADRIFAIASEPIGHADWKAVAEDGFVGIETERPSLTALRPG